ncbi:MAG: efflux RND transporter periplasmic adaptor subunit [Fulvimonas sp.]|nr:efflux RND transporter periplasmic adaptor subunit [Fulvimonas sp.]
MNRPAPMSASPSPRADDRRWWRTPPGATALAGIVALLLLWVFGRSPHGDKAAQRAVPVTVASARQGGFVAYLSEPGTVAPAGSVVVRSRVQGELLRVTFKGGQTVAKGDLLAEIEPVASQAQLDLASGDLARSQALLANAQDTLRRYQTLLSQDSINRQRVADQEALVRQYAAEVKAAQGRLDTAKLQLAYTRITAPIAGVVGLRQVDPGNLVGPTDPHGITVITRLQPSRIAFAVPAGAVTHLLDRLRRGECIPVEAFADDSAERPLGSGRLAAVDSAVDPQTGTLKFEAEFANERGMLLPNQYVSARLPIEVLSGAILVPTAAVQRGAAGAFVYAVGKDGTAVVTPVEPGPADAATTVIASGLAPGTKVVVEGADRLRAGTPLNVTLEETPAPAAGPPSCGADPAARPPAVSRATYPVPARAGRRPDTVDRA